MKAPLSWLREYVAIEMPVEELASRLALTGTEVERVAQVGVSDDGDNLSFFVVGKVLQCGRHPDADKLSVCVVDVGQGQLGTIVCGAPNVAAGQTVAVVLPGGVLPGGMIIKEAKLRGVASAGMIMSEAELGLATKSAGIMQLPDSWRAGERLCERFAISDQVLEVEVTPNRPDCLSIRGLAREIAAITGAPFTEDTSYPYASDQRRVEEDIVIEVLDPDLCPRYAGRVIRAVTAGESPLWLKARLCHVGMRPISNIVDVTNYVQWALGQPLHAFDLHTIRGKRIVVRRAHPGERLVTLDDQERVLSDEMLVIADAERASVVAGIMGGLDSEITASTTDILLEAANFSGPSIMRTSSALALRSEASTRYEKGLDPEAITPALDMACKMFVELCGGTVSSGTVDVREPASAQTTLKLRGDRVRQILGKRVDPGEAAAILTRLGCSAALEGDDLQVGVPSYRADLEREIDLIEEVARVHGLDQIPSSVPGRRVGRGGMGAEQRLIREIEDLLVGAGLSQVINYSFGDDKWPELLRLAPQDVRRRGVVLANPLSGDQSVMQTMLLPGLLGTARRNVSVREERVPIFEVARVFHPSGAEGSALPREETHVGILVAGEWQSDAWNRSDTKVDYFLAKGLVERVSAALHMTLAYSRAEEPFLHPGKSAVVRGADQRQVGWLGEVHPLVAQAYDLRGPVVAAEIDVSSLLAGSRHVVTFCDLLAYPVVEQDLALVVEADVPAAAVVDSLRGAGGDLLESVTVFDVYEGAQLAAGKKSLALRLSFRAPDRTLSETEVNRLRDRMLRKATVDLGAELRG